MFRELNKLSYGMIFKEIHKRFDIKFYKTSLDFAFVALCARKLYSERANTLPFDWVT